MRYITSAFLTQVFFFCRHRFWFSRHTYRQDKLHYCTRFLFSIFPPQFWWQTFLFIFYCDSASEKERKKRVVQSFIAENDYDDEARVNF